MKKIIKHGLFGYVKIKSVEKERKMEIIRVAVREPLFKRKFKSQLN